MIKCEVLAAINQLFDFVDIGFAFGCSVGNVVRGGTACEGKCHK